MSICKRNVILIFGYLLIVALFFIPCKKVFYNFSWEKKIDGNVYKESGFEKLEKLFKEKILEKKGKIETKYLFDDITRGLPPLKEPPESKIDWERIFGRKEYDFNFLDSVLPKAPKIFRIDKIRRNWQIITKDNGKKIKVTNKKEIVFLPFFISRIFRYEKYKKFEKSILVERAKEEEAFKRVLKEEIEGIKFGEETKFDFYSELGEFTNKIEHSIEEKHTEFNEQFGVEPYYHRLDIEFFFTGIAVLIFISFFVYILFCLVLRKPGKEK